jgi:hypothetical protein
MNTRVLALTTAAHLSGDTLAAVKRATLDVVRRQMADKHADHAKMYEK